MNAIMTQDKKMAHIKLQAISREGITQPWGNGRINKASELKRKSISSNADVPAQTGTHFQ